VAMKNLKIYFLFYKTKFLPPLALALFTLLKFKVIQLAVLALLTTTILIWVYQRLINDKKKESLYFYYNLGLTELKLYAFIFFINLTLIVCTNTLIK